MRSIGAIVGECCLLAAPASAAAAAAAAAAVAAAARSPVAQGTLHEKRRSAASATAARVPQLQRRRHQRRQMSLDEVVVAVCIDQAVQLESCSRFGESAAFLPPVSLLN
jgi:aryl-alcohol dehydrogenase-like predicted oxidoreductase